MAYPSSEYFPFVLGGFFSLIIQEYFLKFYSKHAHTIMLQLFLKIFVKYYVDVIAFRILHAHYK